MIDYLNGARSYFVNKGYYHRLYFNLNPKIIFSNRNLKKIIKQIKLQKIIYQPIPLPNGATIPKRSDYSIVNSRTKLKKLNLPQSYKNKTVLDIGCAEGFFLIDAAKRGAQVVLGIDQDSLRVKLARSIVSVWQLGEIISVKKQSYQSISSNQQFDTVYCFSVVHHQHGKVGSKNFADTWAILTDPKYKKNYQNMIKAVKKIASLTKEITYWEYPFTYQGYKTKPKDVDFNLLGKKWVKEGFYRKVDFIGFSSRTSIKDRPLYKAYKHDYIRDDKGFYMDFYKSHVKISYTLSASNYTNHQKNRSFNNVLNSFVYFKKINWTWAPKLLKFSKKSKEIYVQKIDGKSFLECVFENKLNFNSEISSQLAKIEKSLIKFKINYNSATLKDIIIAKKSGKLYLLDFEQCYPGQKYKSKLINELLIDIIRRIFTKKIVINKSLLALIYILVTAKFK